MTTGSSVSSSGAAPLFLSTNPRTPVYPTFRDEKAAPRASDDQLSTRRPRRSSELNAEIEAAERELRERGPALPADPRQMDLLRLARRVVETKRLKLDERLRSLQQSNRELLQAKQDLLEQLRSAIGGGNAEPSPPIGTEPPRAPRA